jgi:hypothetical protein
MKDTKKKWEDELRAQVTENEREIQRIRPTKQKEFQKVEEDLLTVEVMITLCLILKLCNCINSCTFSYLKVRRIMNALDRFYKMSTWILY